MNCASCGRTNRAGARFCGGCGASLAPRCPACGAAGEPDARFCDACGASFSPRAADDGVARKVVTILFADLIGSTALHERLDPESVSRLMEGYHRAVRAPVEAHGGAVVQLLGDGVMCAFGVPRVAEDDALRAVRAAVDVQRAFREFAREQGERVGKLGLRVALNTGEVVVSDDYSAGIGDPLNVAARLQQEARDGDVLIGEATQRLVAGQVTLARVGTFALKGRAEPVTAYRVESLERPTGAAAVAFVGREDELRRITAVYEAAVAAPAARLAVLLGSPGLGKSRLLGEFASRLGERATVLSAACNAAGGATFAPLVEALRTAREGMALVDEAERARIASGIDALLAGTPASPEETFFVVRRLLAALAAVQPLVLAIDDLHWAEPLLLDLVEHLVQWGAGVPLLVLAAARPELRDTRSSLASAGGLVADVVTLGGLDAGAATRLAASVIGTDALPAAVAGRVLATSEGNPLFLGELVRMLVNEGALRREGDRWTTAVELADLEMPPTIQALLAARIERLRPEERLVLERASVVGREFSRAAVAHLLPPEARAELDARLEALRRSELIEPASSWLLGEPVLRFHHVLIRDAAYRRLLRNTRAELHARFAEWLERRAGGSLEHDETIGWHLEQAHQHLRELGPLDAKGRALGESAARYLAAAGRRALARDDLRPAASLLARALERLDSADAARAELALDWCEALLAAGEVGRAAQAIAELDRFTAGSERLRAWHTCFGGELAVLTDPQALHATGERVERAAATLAAAGDGAGEAKAHFVHARALAQLGKIGACEAALDRALAAARRVRDRRRSNAVLAGAPLAALWGPSPVTRASGRCLDVVRVLRITQGAPAVEAVALSCQAVLETLRGRAEAARRMIASSRRMVEELGITQRVLEADLFAGLIELLEGDAVAAERWLRPAYDGLAARGLGIDAAQAAALLGRALLAQGRAAEAEALSHESEALAGDSFKAAIAWRGVRAEALSARGEHAAAVEVARKAVEIAAATDDLLDHADARMALAVALRAAGRRADADAEETRAIELWDAKGATLLAERARRELGRSGQPERLREKRPEPVRSLRRRVRPNAASAGSERLPAIVAARDEGALATIFADLREMVDHPTGSVIDGPAVLSTWRTLLRSEAPALESETLATLGDSLALARSSMSFRALRESDVGPFGETRRDELVLVEAGAGGRQERVEIFAPGRLGDALVRLYQRHAELLSAGPERARCETVARTVAALAGLPDVERLAAVLAPDVEWVDSRNVGAGSIPGAEALLESIRTLIALASDFAVRIDDVLCARPDALLVRWINSGTLRAGGGSFERDLCQLWLFGADGRLTRWEQFDAGRADEALARFDALTAAPDAERSARRVRPNAATANAARLDAAVAARDIDALYATLADGATALHHPTGAAYEERESRRAYEILLATETLHFEHEPLATLGDSLAVCHGHLSFDAAAIPAGSLGAANMDSIVSIEVDAAGQRTHTEFFATDQLGNAVVRLYECYAERLPEGAERIRAEAIAASFSTLAGPYTPGALDAILAPDAEYVDHRPVGFPRASGGDAVRAWLSTLPEVAVDVAFRLDEVLAARPDALVGRWTNTGRERAGGGAFERPFLALNVFGADGRLRRWEHFDVGRADEALARFDALGPEMPPAAFGNTAVRAQGVLMRSWREQRVSDVIASLAPDFVLDDRRSVTGLRLSGDDFVTNLRVLAEAESSEWRSEPLATRGERLALFDVRFGGVSSNGAEFLEEHLAVFECDTRGRWLSVVVFDHEQPDAAYAELDARYAAGEGAGDRRAELVRAFGQAFAARDWDGLAALLAPDLVVHDHRPLGWETLHGPAAYVAALRSLVELAPDAQLRIDHVELSGRGFLCVPSWVGTREGGAFEAPSVFVTQLDAEGRVHRLDQYDTSQLDVARARLAELQPDLLRIPPNAATACADRMEAAFAARDFEAADALCAPGLVYDDRRRSSLVSGDRELFLANVRVLLSGGARASRTVLATLGDRLALSRLVWSAWSDTPFELEVLQLDEVDAQGRLVALIGFDPDDRRDASAELLERYHRGEGARSASPHLVEFARAMNAHDAVAVRATLPDDFAFIDHRRTGFGRLGNADDYVASLEALWAQSDDAFLETLYFLAVEEHASLGVARMSGTLLSGGAFESVFARIGLYRQGRFAGAETFELEDLDLAHARFEALCPNPLRIPPNAATRAMDRFGELAQAADWSAAEALCAPVCQFEDRRRGMSLSGGREMFLASARLIASAGSRPMRTLRATAGDRLALEHVLWINARLGTEVEVLELTEVDRDGCIVATVVFDPDDRRGAGRELFERYLRSDASSWMAARQRELTRALRDRDLARARAALPDDFFYHDHRRTSAGRLDTADGYIAWLATLFQQSPDGVVENVCYLATESWGELGFGRTYGTLADGGAFESLFVRISLQRGGEFVGAELFELEDLERARARFEELRPDPLRIPPNAATRALERTGQVFSARDWVALRSLASPQFRFEDRRKYARVSGDVELYIRNLEVVRAWPGRETRREPVATAGERLSIDRIFFTADPDGSAFDGEFLRVTEIDAEGRLHAVLHFDPEDRATAFIEAHRRFAAGEAGAAGRDPVSELGVAFTRHAWEELRSCLAEDAAICDHRRLGYETFDREGWLASLAVFAELAPDVRSEPFRVLAWNRRGRASLTRVLGTTRDGAEFENLLVSVFLAPGDRILRFEMFDIADVDRALARFEELTAS